MNGVKLSIVLLALLAWTAQAGAISINQYQDLEKMEPKLAELYLGGLIGAFTVSNLTLEGRKQARLYCPPSNLFINPDNLRHLIADFIKTSLKGEWVGTMRREEFFGGQSSLDASALRVLQETFPCNK
jgi:hypothetical protein